MEAFINIFQATGLAGIIVFIIWQIVKTYQDNKKERLESEAKLKHELDLQKLEAERDQQLVQTIVNIVKQGPTHTPEEEMHNARIAAYINELLKCLLDRTGAHRAFIFSFHNGERSIDGHGFHKMTCRNEQTVSWAGSIMANCQGIQRTSIPTIYTEIMENGKFYLDNVDDLKEEDALSYNFFNNHGAQSIFLRALKRQDGLICGFIGIEYLHDGEYDIDTIDHYLTLKASAVIGAMLGGELEEVVV